MRGGKSPRGYTILEVMIFMAISGLMFLIAANFVSGRQSRAEFRQGMNAVNESIKQVINDVNNGFYPSNSDFKCTADNLGNPPVITLGSADQGTNKGCVFMGKVMQFGSQGTEGRGYNIFTVVGRQYKTTPESGVVPSNFSESKPKAMLTPKDLTDYKQLEHGVQLTKMLSGATPISGVGFYSSFGSYDGGGSLNSGAQSVWAVIIPGAAPYWDKPASTMASHIDSQTIDSNIVYQPDILMCFDSGTGQYATLTIGGTSGQRLTSKYEILATNPADCL